MAFKNKEIHNPKTGQHIKFLQTRKDTNGALLEMESVYDPFSTEPPAHYHPYQAENFRVIEGELTVRINGTLKIFKKGDTLNIAPNVVHSMWNNSERKTVVNWKVKPALDTEYLLETTAALAEHNKTDEAGRPPILQVAVMMDEFSDMFRLATPPYPVQRIAFSILTPISFLLGYKATYEKYLD